MEHQLVFMKLLNSGTKKRVTMEKVVDFAVGNVTLHYSFLMWPEVKKTIGTTSGAVSG